MKKAIKQYEEKNKIIEQIQKNLRMIYPYRHRQQKRKLKGQTNFYQLDLPFVNSHRSAPKSETNAGSKTSSYHSFIHQIPSVLTGRVSRPWVHTIALMEQQKKYPNHNVLLKHRVTQKSFNKITHKNSKSSLQKQSVPNSQGFVSPSKIKYALKQHKFDTRFTQNSEDLNSKQSYSVNHQQMSTKYEKKIFQQIYSTQLGRKQNKKESQEESIQLPSLPNFKNHQDEFDQRNRYRKQKMGTNHSGRRSCSPWHHKQQGEQLLQIWDAAI